MGAYDGSYPRRRAAMRLLGVEPLFFGGCRLLSEAKTLAPIKRPITAASDVLGRLRFFRRKFEYIVGPRKKSK